MRIAIDIRSLQEGFHSGVQEYAIRLLGALWDLELSHNEGARNEYVLFTSGINDALPEEFLSLARDALDRGVSIERVHVGLPNKLLNILFRLPGHSVRRVLGDPGVVFHPNISIAPIPVPGAKHVLTVHDLSFVRHPEFFSRKRQLWHRLAHVGAQIRRADTVIAVSHSTSSDIVSQYGIDSGTIRVIYSGVGEEFHELATTKNSAPKDDTSVEQIRERYKLPERFILSLGTIDPRKNPFALFEAFESLKRNKKFDDVGLVMVGPKAWSDDEDFALRISRSFAREDIIVTGEVPSADRPSLYRLATVFAYPSFFEGFGFPPLEAMACGTPVVTSFNSSLPEAVGDAALLVDPYRPDELAHALVELLTDEQLRTNMIHRGKTRADLFKWSQCAGEVRELFESIVK